MASSWLKRFASSGQACRSCWRAAMRNCLRRRTSIYLGSANLTSRTSSPRKLQRCLGRSFPLGFGTSKFESITPAGISHRDARNFGRSPMTAVCAQRATGIDGLCSLTRRPNLGSDSPRSLAGPPVFLRAMISERRACADSDLICTGLNRPVRARYASPGASLRSVLWVSVRACS